MIIKYKSMKIFPTVLLLFLFFVKCNYSLCSQEYDDFYEEYDEEIEILKSEYNPRFGVFLNYGLNFHHTNFPYLPNYPICCNVFKNGFGAGFNFGGSALFRVNNDWYYGGKISFGNLNGKITTEQKIPLTVNGMLVDGTTKSVIDVSLNNFIFSPFVAYSISQISKNFYVSLGMNIGATVSANFAQHEELLSPNVGTFENGYRVRNIKSGDLPNMNSFLFAGNVGISYELPLNKNNNLRLVPEINYNYWFLSPVQDLNWNISQLTFGIGIRYNAPPQKEPPPEEPILPELPPQEEPEIEYIFTADVSHKIFANNLSASENQTINSSQKIIIEDFTQTNLKPLLNYIFFDDNSARIPARYIKIKPDETNAFNYNEFQRLNSLETYYHLLNIIGYRLTQFPTATIELVGTNTNKGSERNNIELSQARAENVKRYLIDVWKIEPRRIKTTARNLPKEPTKPTEESGDEENRRVEIYSSNSKIIEPIFSMDTVSVLRNEKIYFYPKAESSFGIKNWKLEISNADTVIKTWNGAEDLPNEIIWETTNKSLVDALKSTLKYQLTVNDKIGETQKTQQKNIPIDRITVQAKRSDNYADTEYEYYSLILFEFASRTLDAKHNSVIDFIKSRIKPNSKVIISGYTDIIGNDEVNKRIATERARAAANRLKFDNVEIRGIGKDELLYDNTFPEGRFYCRTVTIEIETPIIGE